MTHAVAKELYAIRSLTGDRFFKLFDDWLSLATDALSSDPDKESRYMAIMSKYGPRVACKPHPADHFANALGAFMLDCQTQSLRDHRFSDILGTIYETEALATTYSGQFFTPEPLAQMMARMMIEPTQEPIGIADPACGSGRFFIAAQPLAPRARFTGTDTDLTCVRMCALNMLVRNADAVIVHGNTLSLECHGGYRVRSSVFGGSLRPLTAEEATHALGAVKRALDAEQPQPALPLPLPPTPTATPLRPAGARGAARSIPVVSKKGQFDFGF